MAASIFSGFKRDNEEAQKAFDYFNQNHQKLLENQAKLMAAIKNLTAKVEELEEKIAFLQAPQPAIVDANPGVASETFPEAFPEVTMNYASEPEPVRESLPVPFFANLEGKMLIPVSDDMRENALFVVVPQSGNQAMVEFNTLSVSTYISGYLQMFEDSFDCQFDNKDPNQVIAENTTTAHLQDGAWMIDGRIRLRFV